MKNQRITTEDGSDSIYVPALDETYHSKHGAIQESTHVFIENGLLPSNANDEKGHVSILEFGFGTGLNALLSFLFAKNKVDIDYTTLEKYPIEPKEAAQLNYGQQLEAVETFEKMVTCEWDTWQSISDTFRLRKIETDFRNYIPDQAFDLLYFDAFAPSKQPELWSIEVLEICYEALHENGIFVTYSAKGQLRRDLKELGFKVERLPGPPGKFEMLRATK